MFSFVIRKWYFQTFSQQIRVIPGDHQSQFLCNDNHPHHCHTHFFQLLAFNNFQTQLKAAVFVRFLCHIKHLMFWALFCKKHSLSKMQSHLKFFPKTSLEASLQ